MTRLTVPPDSLYGMHNLPYGVYSLPGAAPRVAARLGDQVIRLKEVTLRLPVEVADYVDFYASEYHAANLGRLFRPGIPDPLTPNWKHLPIGYHGRAGSIVVSGTDIVRPAGQRKDPGDPVPVFGPLVRLDIGAEVGFIVGAPGPDGTRIGFGEARGRIVGNKGASAGEP